MTSIDRREALRRAALLLGGAVSASTAAAVLAGCGEAAAATLDTPEWEARATSAAANELIAAVADQIIPRTDTPGARDAGVHRFIDTMLAEYYSPAERETLLAGFAEIDSRARAAHQKTFVRCSSAQQRAIVESVDREAFPTTAPTLAGSQAATDASKETERGGGGTAVSTGTAAVSKRHYFRTIKELVIVGYYTSQPGATKELRYVQVPGRFDGCVPMSSVGRTWAV